MKTSKKNILKIALAFVLVLSVVFAAVACTNNENEVTNADLEAALDEINAKLQSMDDGTTQDYTDIAAQLQAISASLSDADADLVAYYNALVANLNALSEAINPTAEVYEYSEECYAKLQYIDNALRDRDCINGADFKIAQKWIAWTLMQAGYAEEDITYQDVTMTKYYNKDLNLKQVITAGSYTTDGKYYARSGRSYVEVAEADMVEGGTYYVKASIVTPNIVVKKQGKSDKQIIVGAHYDGTGTGDNGSGIALTLTTAEKLANIETEYTIVFVFFTAEEYGCYGSTQYADSMSDEEIDNTLYMINIDSIVCGDYAYLYGGVQQDDLTVTDAEAYYNAVAVAESLGLSFKTNPWTVENPAPGYDEPDYVSPSTGDWSDHVGFKNVGIKYLYLEATNWEIPGPYYEYDGYGETYIIGMLMNTENDYLEYIEKYFPGRPLEHFKTFSALLYALVTQSDVNF